MRSLLALVVIVLSVTACTQVEGTGRERLLLTTETQENQQGGDAYQEILAKEKMSTDAEMQAMVERVGKRLAAVAPDHHFQWEFHLIDSPTINAFCLPGGKVAVYSGILPYVQNEAALAAVMGHEIGHAIARHGGERMTQGMFAEGAQTALGEYLKARGVEDTKSNIAMAAFGVGTQVGVLLPFSRTHESEADRLGLQYMSKAGYDPHEAIRFWQRFAVLSKSAPPKWLSTHPPSDERAADLQKRLPEADKNYNAAKQKFGNGASVPAKYLK